MGDLKENRDFITERVRTQKYSILRNPLFLLSLLFTIVYFSYFQYFNFIWISKNKKKFFLVFIKNIYLRTHVCTLQGLMPVILFSWPSKSLTPKRIFKTKKEKYVISSFPYYFILFYIITFYSILYYPILTHSILHYSILYYYILFYIILSFIITFYSILYYPILLHSILYYSILYYYILFYIILSYIITFYSTILVDEQTLTA